MKRVAFVVGRGGGDMGDVLPAVDTLVAARNRVRILFLDAADDVLIRRFEGTRRRHPQVARGVVDSIADERLLLKEPARPGGPGHRHWRTEHQPTPDPPDGGVRSRRSREAPCGPRCSRSASNTASHWTST